MAVQNHIEDAAPEFPPQVRTGFPASTVFHNHELDRVQEACSGLRAIVDILAGDDLAGAMNADADPQDDAQPRLSAPNRDGLLSAARALVERVDDIVYRHANTAQAERDRTAREDLLRAVAGGSGRSRARRGG